MPRKTLLTSQMGQRRYSSAHDLYSFGKTIVSTLRGIRKYSTLRARAKEFGSLRYGMLSLA